LIEVRCFHSWVEVAALREQINTLNLASARPDPFSSFEFFQHFLQFEKPNAPAGGLRLWFLCAFRAGSLVGYMALKQTTHHLLGMAASKVDFLVTHDADRPQLIARSEDVLEVSSACYRYLLERRHEWSFLELRQQDCASPLFPLPADVDFSGCWVTQWPALDNGTIGVQWQSLEAYFRSFSKKFRSNVSRQMRTLLAVGEVEYLHSADAAVTPALFDLYCSIEPRSWKSRAGVTIGRHPNWSEYFRGLLDPQQPMRVSIHILLLDGVPIAGLITGAFERGLYALHIVYDRSVSALGPGSAVLLMSMRQAIDGRYAFFNLLSGFGYYKSRWQAQMSATRNAQIYRFGTPYFWRRVLGDVKRRLFPAGAVHTQMLFNPMRRGALQQTEEPVNDRVQKPQLSAPEQARINTLINRVRQGQGEFLSSQQLADIMPFDTQRAARKPTPQPASARTTPGTHERDGQRPPASSIAATRNSSP